MNIRQSPRIPALASFAVAAVLLLACERKIELASDREGREPALSVDTGDPNLPGVASIDRSLTARLNAALEAQGPAYQPRTHHLNLDGSPRFTNRLILESSPYLLQHAHNPVNWYPWSEAAFERARRDDKPIFLSVGYSTCHWCHVMERESFEDEAIAEFLNKHFIAIKVDREERPDVDSVYMKAVQMLTGRGGWPMTVIMNADGQPFFGGTYFPPRRGVRGNRAGLNEVLREIVRLRAEEPAQVQQQAALLSERVALASIAPEGAGVPSAEPLISAVQTLAERFDPVDGGFGRAPKFPQPSQLALLMRYARRTQDPAAIDMVKQTLTKMARGGIYDHVGGGFHRYSTDSKWLVPHFEKMLYDNAQLASVYVEAWQLTGDEMYRRVARDVLRYVESEMTSPEGGFYSATDADSATPSGHDEEGWFFTWTDEELTPLLGADRARIVKMAYGVTPGGNFEGRSIFHRTKNDAEVATKVGAGSDRVRAELAEARRALYRARASRPPPLRDEKIIAAWNGLMISAFARGGFVLGEPKHVEVASKAAAFVLSQMRVAGGGLVRTSKDGIKGPPAFLDDYAFMIAACLDLYEVTGAPQWLTEALALQRYQDTHFRDERAGGYFLTPDDHETLLIREKPSYDGAVPSGNSVSAMNLLRLAELTGDPAWQQQAEELFAAFGSSIQSAPLAAAQLLLALDYYLDVPLEIVLVSPETRDATEQLARVFRSTFLPNRVFLMLSEEQAAAQAGRIPWLTAKCSLQGKPTAYVCERGRCELPTSDPHTFRRQLEQRRPYPSGAPPRLSIAGAKRE